jgi:hypothetical protein
LSVPILAGLIYDSDHSTSVVERTLLLLLLLLRFARIRLLALTERLRRRQKLRRLESVCESGLEGLSAGIGARRGVAVSISVSVVVALTERVTSGGRGGRIAAHARLVAQVHHLKKKIVIFFFTND